MNSLSVTSKMFWLSATMNCDGQWPINSLTIVRPSDNPFIHKTAAVAEAAAAVAAAEAAVNQIYPNSNSSSSSSSGSNIFT